MKLPINLLTKFSGYNWYKLGIKLLLLVSLVATVHFHAVYSCNLEHEQQKTSQATKKAEKIVDNVNKRLPQVAKDTGKVAAKNEKTEQAKRNLDEEIKATPANGCNLTDSELRFYRDLSEQTAITR